MNNMDEIFPSIKRSLENLIEDEEGNIPGKRLLVLGSMVIILGSLLSIDALAGHRSHSSHQSHSSHSSHQSSSSSHGSHSSHESHESHTSHSSTSAHESHSSHTSHSNTSAHSNSLYSSEGDVAYNAPAASSIPSVENVVTTTTDTFQLPDVNENIEIPNATPTSGIMAPLAVPSSSIGTKIDAGDLHEPSATEKVE